MNDLIRSLVAWIGPLIKPRGKPCGPAFRPHSALMTPPPAPDTSLPTHRSPYGLDTPLDGTATAAVRPYLTAHEQRQRRREAAMAALGMDTPGPYWIHGVEIA
ncbi:hypothetical protein E0500_006310 [Streptomyces sp. KM273126]|uniref:hypothetical protein n=1 Tax=Streptomyces sp. KM273126 TaxID=2545247 RepID=UPI00103C767C|nr:hypothetical protein [Streptomyces sp. KM273126]MBA2807067.1 hypothetical protein [Streptomyces sp. KM273126]